MSDEIIWNEYNVTGFCSRQSCPLANAKYATVKQVDGKLYLYMKTAERAHTPAKLWERIKLSKNYNKALKQIDDHLLYWNKFLIHKCKQRLTRLTQVMITERRMALREEERHYVGIAPKVKRRDENRERKALAVAKIEKAIEKELLDRLKSGAYGDKPLNVDENIWKRVLGHVEDEQTLEDEYEEEDESDLDEVEYIEDDGDEELVNVEDLEAWLEDPDSSRYTSSSDDSDSDGEDLPTKRKNIDKNIAKKKRARLEIEYENEALPNNQELAQ